MSGIRAFCRSDIPRVADLWLRVFRRHEGPASERLRDYFAQIFFENPWHDIGLPSLLYEDPAGRVLGFLGVIPRVMRFDGEPIRVAVGTQLMVDDVACRAYAAASLMRAFLAGEQDLSLSDGANEAAERLWQACGGKTALLYSLNWSRILRPAQYLGNRLQERKQWALVGSALQPLYRGLDALTNVAGVAAYRRPVVPAGALDESPTDDTLLWCVRQLSGSRQLRPEYELDSLRWLLQEAAQKKNHGTLKKGMVRERNGRIAGWFLYYLTPGQTGQVLQFGATRESGRRVLDHLFHHAWSQGAVAISGQLEPRFFRELVDSRCSLAWPGYGVLMHSRRREVLDAICRGDAFLTRLEGEWWARFSDPEWSLKDLPLSAAGGDRAGLQKAPQLNAAH